MEIICIGRITSYLTHNVRLKFQIYSSSVSDWCITSFPVCNLIYYYVPYSFQLVRFMSEYKLNPNPLWIYVPPFITQVRDGFYFPLISNLRVVLACCIKIYLNIYICLTGDDVFPILVVKFCTLM